MLQKLPIVLAQVNAGNTSQDLLNEIHQLAYSLYRAKKISKKVYENLIQSIKGILYSSDRKKNLSRYHKHIALSNLSIYYTWKNIKKEYKNNKFKITAPTWIAEFELSDGSYFVSHIQDYFQYIIKRHENSGT